MTFTDGDAEDFDSVIAVNLRGTYLGALHALKALRAQGQGGAVVMTSSVAGLVGGRHRSLRRGQAQHRRPRQDRSR